MHACLATCDEPQRLSRIEFTPHFTLELTATGTAVKSEAYLQCLEAFQRYFRCASDKLHQQRQIFLAQL